MTTALTINYNTPDYLERLLKSFRQFYPKVPYVVIDGSSEEMYAKIKDFPRKYNIELIHYAYNIHHGPGLTDGLKRISTEQVLFVDSDIIVLSGGWIEDMEKHLHPDSYGIGDIQQELCNNRWIDYLHPALCLVNRKVALQYPDPMKGGAPLLNAMEAIRQSGKDILQRAGWLTADFHKHAGVYIQHNHNHEGMGTVGRTGGYHLDTLGVVIATYERPDGKTPEYLDRTLTLIDYQTFRDYQVFVVGDAWKDEAKLKNIVEKHPQTVWHNLAVSPERERYGYNNMQIWCAGGVTAANKGIDMALEKGISYICHQAHDDLWEPNHLALINEIIKAKHPLFCCTLSTYFRNKILPDMPVSNRILPIYPIDGGMIASSTCINYAETKLRVIDRLHEQGIMSPCDAYLWECLRNELKAKNQTGWVGTTVTCHHDEEGYAIRGN